MITGKLYDWLKWIAQVVLPALATMVFSLSDALNIENAFAIVGIITAVDTFLGAILGFSQVSFKKNNESEAGYLTQTGTDAETGMPNLGLIITKAPSELMEKQTVTLKIQPPPPGEPTIQL